MMAFLPILLITFLFIGLYVIQGYAQNQGLKWIFGFFLVILLGSTVIFYILPESNNKNLQLLSEKDETYSSEFYEAALAGKVDEVDGVKLRNQWSFELSGNQLDIPETSDPVPFLLVERKATDDGQVEVLHYTSKLLVGDIDFSKQRKAIDVSLQGNRLFVTAPEYVSVKIASFKKDFVVSQFSEDPKDRQFDSLSFANNEVVYVRIPNNVHISEMENIQFVGEGLPE